MATPTPRRPPQAPKKVYDDVDPRWLLSALGISIAGAAVLAYLSVCLLLYQGGWQRMIFPSPKVDKTPSIPFDAVRFDAASTGNPRLSGWWIPGASPSAPTILFLHDARGSLAQTVATLTLLHQAGPNVFAFDYRGFGQSDGPHPTESRMAEDSRAALIYLINTRHIRAARVIPYGEGLASALATELTNAHPEMPALILENPYPDARARVIAGAQSRLLPMNLLLQEHFDIATALLSAKTPKLLFADTPFGFESDRLATNQALFRSAPDPKLTVTFRNPHSEAAYIAFIQRFLDQYVPAPIDTLKATP